MQDSLLPLDNDAIARLEEPVVVVETGGVKIGFRLREVEEVAWPREITPVPLAPKALLGAISLQGRVIALFSPDALLPLPCGPEKGPLALVFSRGAVTIGLMVKQVLGLTGIAAQEDGGSQEAKALRDFLASLSTDLPRDNVNPEGAVLLSAATLVAGMEKQFAHLTTANLRATPAASGPGDNQGTP